MPDDKLVNIACRVPPIVQKRIAEMADKAGMPMSTYAAMLLQAAYAARVQPPTGDRTLDAAVGRVVILWPQGLDTATIARAVGLSEAAVVRILDAWRGEVLMRGAA